MTAQCRAGCGVPLDPVLVGAGQPELHPTCMVPAGPVLPVLRGVLERHQQGSRRSMQRHLGPSQIGHPCDRHIAYRLRGGALSEPLKWAPLVGTWCHAGIAEAFWQENARLGRERYLIEQRVEFGSTTVPSGTCDLFDTDAGEATDWKVTGKSTMDDYRRHGPGDVYRVQAHMYGYGWERAGYPVRSVRVVFLPRWSHVLSDAHEWAEPYSRELAMAALARADAIAGLAAALDLDAHPERYAVIHATPGEPDTRDGMPVGANCRYCPWHRAWPEPDGPADATGCPGH